MTNFNCELSITSHLRSFAEYVNGMIVTLTLTNIEHRTLNVELWELLLFQRVDRPQYKIESSAINVILFYNTIQF